MLMTVVIGNATLYYGDCFDILPTLAESELAACISDMPYGCTENAWDKKPPLPIFWALLWPCLRQNAAVALFGQSKFFIELCASQIQYFRYDLVYEKPMISGYLNARYRPMRGHENIALFYRKGTTYNPQTIRLDKMVRKKVVSKYSACYGPPSGQKWAKIAAEGGRLHVYTHKQPCSIIPKAVCGGQPKSDKGHPTQKPLKLMEWLVKTYTNEGDTVLDPFMGSGTTGLACLNTGRKFVGIEKERRWFDLACKRMTTLQGKLMRL